MTTPADSGEVGRSAGGEASQAVQDAAQALLRLAETRPDLGRALGRLAAVVATEASRSPRFATALQRVLAAEEGAPTVRRTGRRTPGVIDPFALYAQGGEAGLRRALAQLDLERLRDIVAEHGMDHDRLAMKWKDPGRVIDRIVEKVVSRAAKGSAFRTAST